MKKITLYLALLLALLLSVSTTSKPVQAQEELDTILARAAAKSFLITLTRPELSSLANFYVQDGVNADATIAQLGTVTGYSITHADWLEPGQTFQVEANLQPGNRQVVLQTAKTNGRWQVVDVQTTGDSSIVTNTGATTTASTTTGQLQPVAGNGSGKIVFQTRNGGDIYIINADGTNLQRVTYGIDPQLSPDGTQIAFTRWDPMYTLYTINIDGTNETPIVGNKTLMKSPTWSADGTKIVFSYRTYLEEGGQEKINPQRLAERAAQRGESVDIPEIPDNARSIEIENGIIKFVIPPDAHWSLGLVDLVNDEYRDLATGSQYNYAPVWHPIDANKLLWRGDKGIAKYSTQSQTSQPISFDDRDRGPISVSPDGSKIAFSYWQDGHWEIHTMNIDGSNRQRLTETPLYVLVQNSRGETYINEQGYLELSSAQPYQHPNPNWDNAAPVWSPDGSKIAFMTNRTGQWEIWIMNADGSNQHPMFTNGALDGLEFDYTGVDERMISWQ